jgi:hypothetical protein
LACADFFQFHVGAGLEDGQFVAQLVFVFGVGHVAALGFEIIEFCQK